MVEIERDASVTQLTPQAVISWGAIFAGVVVLLATSLLLMLFGAAIGFSVIDVSDLDAIGEGLGIGTAVWVFLSTLAVFYIGGLIAAHLSGRMSHMAGMLHGVTVWAVASIVMMLVDAALITSLVQTTVSTTGKVVSATGSLGQQAFKGIKMLGGGAAELAGSSYTDSLRARLKAEAARVISESDPEGGADVSQQEIRQAIDDVDAELLQSVAELIIAGDLEGAQRELRRGLDLSRAEVQEIVDGVSNRLSREASDSEMVQQVQTWIEEQVDEGTQEVAEISGPQVSRSELRSAVDQLTVEVTLQAAQAMLTGNTQRAKDIIAANTNLSETEVNAIVDGVTERLEQEGDQMMAEFKERVEQVSDYVQWVLWLYFFTAALSLGAAAIGGFVGSHRGEIVVRTDVHSRTELR